MIDSALIYAAGRGTRMGKLTENTPKPLLPINGQVLIDYTHNLLQDAGLSQIHVNAAYLSEQIETHFQDKNVTVHIEPEGAYETGGTLKNLASILPEHIVAINSDTIFFDENPVVKLLAEGVKDYDAMLVLIPREKAMGNDGKGDFFWDGHSLSFRGAREEAPYVYTGLQIIKPSRALEFDETVFSTLKIWDKLIGEGKIGAMVYEGRWLDVGNLASYERAKELLGAR